MTTVMTKYGNLKLGEARTLFFLENGLPPGGGESVMRWSVTLGKLSLCLPNFQWRRRAVPCHDLHHIITEYECNPIGEVQTAAWEFAAGRFPHLAATLFCLPLIAAGAVLWPRRTFRAFMRGRRSTTLYATPITAELLGTRVKILQDRLLPAGEPKISVRDALAYGRLVSTSLALVLSPVIAAALLVCANRM
jgi:hypothetical protein